MPSPEYSVAVLESLRSIDASLKALLALSQRRLAAASGGAGIASDHDLDGPHGDPTIKIKDPRDWSGPSMKGRAFSQCPAVYLELLAERYDYFAQKAAEEGDPKKEKYARLDGSRARGWAARIRSGKHTPAPVEPGVDAEWAGASDWPTE